MTTARNKDAAKRLLLLLSADPETAAEIPIDVVDKQLRERGIDPDEASARLKTDIEKLLAETE
ncbi:hypothetical protein CL628_03855 [bacterium]|nr:hypothetical protein [bacterium]